MRRLTAVVAAGALLLAACGDDDSEGSADTTAASSTAAPTTAAPTTAAPTTAAPTTAAPTTAAPTTAAPTTAAATSAPSEPGGGDDEAAATAWALVFDSTASFDQKAPHLADADALAATVEAYAATGDGFGGITLVPTAVVVDGDSAAITYDVEFGGNPAYGDQQGTLTRVDGVWVVGRDEFCSFMASARVGCEA
ncbi:MAG: hypothetical protein AAGA42_05000 [Actinomycetota bacterium]